MSGSVNKVILVGNLGLDPQIRNTQDGSKIVSFSIATSEVWKDKNSGERKDKTEWHRVVVFNERLADICEKYLRKGSKVYIEGQLQTRKWTDNAGQEKYTTEVVLAKYRGEMTMLEGRSESGVSHSSDSSISYGGDDNKFISQNRGSHSLPSPELDDEIPF